MRIPNSTGLFDHRVGVLQRAVRQVDVAVVGYVVTTVEQGDGYQGLIQIPSMPRSARYGGRRKPLMSPVPSPLLSAKERMYAW